MGMGNLGYSYYMARLIGVINLLTKVPLILQVGL